MWWRLQVAHVVVKEKVRIRKRGVAIDLWRSCRRLAIIEYYNLIDTEDCTCSRDMASQCCFLIWLLSTANPLATGPSIKRDSSMLIVRRT